MKGYPKGYLAYNAAQIVKYLEHVWPLIEKGIVMPEEPPDRKARGSSRSVLSDWAEDLIWTNRDVSRVLEPIIQEGKRSHSRLLGVYFSSLLVEVADDPMAVARFRAEREESRRAQAFFGMCQLFARVVAAKHDGPEGPYRLYVALKPEEEAAQALEEQREDPNLLGGQARTFTAHDSYRRMVEDMERLVLAGTHSKEGAKAAKAEELMCSMGRVRDAITFVNAERETVFSRGVAA